MSAEEQNATYRAQARYQESVAPIWARIASLTPGEYEQRYLAAWQRVYQKNPYYLYPDDRLNQEFEAPRLEEVGTLSYENTALDVQQARADTLQLLTSQAEAVLANAPGDTLRSSLATLLRKAAGSISCHALSDRPNESEIERERRILAERPVFETLQDPRFTPILPERPGPPDSVVDEPKRVGGILGQLEHFANLRKRFLAEEASAPLAKGKPAANTLSDSTPLGIADIWAGLLRAGVNFTLTDLDRLLFKLGLLSEINPETPTRDFKGSAGLGIIEALREQRYLPTPTNNAQVARVFAGRYGSGPANPETLCRANDVLPKPAHTIYTRAPAFLPRQ